MFEECAKQFMTAGDTTMYYYALYSMALELAEQKKADSTQLLLRQIEENTSDPYTISLVNMTRARLNLNLQQYDTALFYANQSIKLHSQEPSYYVIKAQAFEFLHQYDSALLYASYVMSLPTASAQERRNMLYILTYYDDEIDDDELKRRSEERDDINRYVLTPLRHKLTQAVDLLKQEMDSNPNYATIVFWVFSLCLIGGIAWISKVKHKQSIESISRKRDVAIQEIRLQQEQKYRQTLEEEKKQAELQQQQQLISQQIDNYNQQTLLRQQQMLDNIELHCEAIRHSHNWQKEIHWNDFDELCYFINEHFGLLANKLKAVEVLDEKEIRLCILVLLNFPFSNDEQAETIIYSKSGFGKFKYHMTKKLGTTAKDLREFLLKMILSMADFER